MLRSQSSFPLGRWLLIGNVAILALIGIAAVQASRASLGARTEQARHAAENLALALSIGIASDIKQIDNALLSTLSQLDQAGVLAGDAAWTIAMADKNRALVPHVDALRVTDAFGHVITTDKQAIEVGDRDYFKAARAAPDKLAMSEPLKGRIIKKWGVIFARARADVDGQFQGVVYSSLSTDHFIRIFDDMRIGASGAVSVRTTALNLVARYTPNQAAPESAIGTNNVSEELREALSRNSERGFYISRTSIDGIERANAYRQVPGYPLTVIVGMGTDDFYEPGRRDIAVIAGLAGLLAAMVMGISVLAYRAQRKQLSLHQSIQTLASQQQALLDNELVGMARLRDRIQVWHNRALSEMFGYEHHDMVDLPSRSLYPDDASYERIGQAYAVLEEGRQFRAQLQLRRKDGHLLWIDLSGVRLPDGDSLWMMVDITALKASEDQARHMALHDGLTGLVNRSGLESRLGDMFGDARRHGHQVALCFVDLDGFKQVNDEHGHEAGDALLRIAAQRIASCTRSHDLVVRMGGDEFVVVLTRLHDAAETEPVLKRILEVLATPFSVRKGVDVRIGASLGVAMFPKDGQHAHELLAKADAAMYAAKRSGKGQFSFYKPK